MQSSENWRNCNLKQRMRYLNLKLRCLKLKLELVEEVLYKGHRREVETRVAVDRRMVGRIGKVSCRGMMETSMRIMVEVMERWWNEMG